MGSFLSGSNANQIQGGLNHGKLRRNGIPVCIETCHDICQKRHGSDLAAARGAGRSRYFEKGRQCSGRGNRDCCVPDGGRADLQRNWRRCVRARLDQRRAARTERQRTSSASDLYRGVENKRTGRNADLRLDTCDGAGRSGCLGGSVQALWPPAADRGFAAGHRLRGKRLSAFADAGPLLERGV